MNFKRTGEFRCPRKGEWFEGYNLKPRMAYLDFTEQRFHILVLEKEQ